MSAPLKNFGEIRNFVEKQNFQLLSSEFEYKGNYSKLKAICSSGHTIDICWAEFKRGCRCPVCSGVSKPTIDEIKEYTKTFGYECLSESYKNGHSKLMFKCPQEHIYETTWWIFKAGNRCRICDNIRRSIKYSGPNCNFWKGGISCEPYCSQWIPEFKDLIKYRDSYRCLNPECTSGKRLIVHHVDYNKKNCSKENLVTICQSCNAKANFDRDWHTLWYQTILNKRYNYVYGRQKLC